MGLIAEASDEGRLGHGGSRNVERSAMNPFTTEKMSTQK